MNGFLHQVTSHPAWPILPIGMVGVTWLGLSLRLSMNGAEDARRTHEANVSPAMRFALYFVLAAGSGILFSSLINWFLRILLARSLDQRFAERLAK